MTRLSEPQRLMLSEIEQAGTLYVRRYSAPGRTAQALSNRGLITCSEPDYSPLSQDGWVLTEAGKELLK